jgi:hypothetical protein
MPEIATIAELPARAIAPPISCSLRRKEVVGRNGPIPLMAEVEIKNISQGTLEIEYRMTALQFLNLVVTDANGKLLSEGHFGDRFAPTEHPRTLRLGPGETHAANIHLFATASKWKNVPGLYLVRATYEYNKVRATSEPVEVTIESSFA